MNASNPERRLNILGPPSSTEELHGRLMMIRRNAAFKATETLEINDPENGAVGMWVYVTGATAEDRIITIGPDDKLHYLVVEIFYDDEYQDVGGIGHDASGEQTQIWSVNSMAELACRRISVLIYDVSEASGPIHDEEGNILGTQCGWEISYDVHGGWDIKLWKNSHPRERGSSGDWLEPTQKNIRFLEGILQHAERKFM